MFCTQKQVIKTSSSSAFDAFPQNQKPFANALLLCYRTIGHMQMNAIHQFLIFDGENVPTEVSRQVDYPVRWVH